MSSSWVELCMWYDLHGLGDFPWDEWIDELELPMPLYSLSKILDASAAYDMAVHALHWQGGEDLRPVRLTKHMSKMMRAVGVCAPSQQMYMARALYAHCTRYVTGMPAVRNPPTNHLDFLPVVPHENLLRLASATLTPMPADSISAWLERAIVHHDCRPTKITNVYRSKRTSGRRARKHSAVAEHSAVRESTQAMADEALAAIMDLSPRHVPSLTCQVTGVSTGRVSLVLCAQQHAPCDE